MHPNQSDMQKDSAVTFILHHFRDSYKILPGNLFIQKTAQEQFVPALL